MSTETTEQDIIKSSELDRLQDNLQELLHDLRRNGYKAGIDQYLSAQALFIHWQGQTVTSQFLCASLAALFSTSIDEQQRFAEIFQAWYQRYGVQVTPQTKTAQRLSTPPTWSKIPRISRFARVLTGFLVLLLAVMLIWGTEPPPGTGIDQPISGPITKPDTEKVLDKLKPQQFIPVPHMPAEPVVAPAIYRHWSSRLQYLQWLPLVGFLIWFALRCFQRYLTLSRRRSQTDEPVRLEFLRLKQSATGLFSALALKPVLRAWRRFLPFRSHRLNECGTVRQTIQHNGYVQVVYKQRLLPPEHVLLIDRRHYDDYAARLAAELRQRMQQEGLFVTCYQYDADPQYCWPITGTGRYYSLDQLADRHQGQSLLVIGNAATFFRGQEQRQIQCRSDQSWMSKTLLSINTPDDWGSHEKKLMQAGFRVTPFTRRGLLQLIDKLKPKQVDQYI